MRIDGKELLKILRSHGVEEIYHANTVCTSCHFLHSRALLARGCVEAMQLFQTSQYTDRIDKKYGLWMDVFADSCDIHVQAGNRNNYGPVLFRLSSSIVEEFEVGEVWVTRFNPTKWKDRSRSERWFNSLSELEDGFSDTTFDQMIVFRASGNGRLPFGDFLNGIVLDDPSLTLPNGQDCFDVAYRALVDARARGRVDVRINRRCCEEHCECKATYAANRSSLTKYFRPDLPLRYA